MDSSQAFLLPPSPRDWLPEDHLAWFLADTVEQLDLEPFLQRYRYCGKGEQAYPPQVMLRILLYAYATGVRSSRKIAASLVTDVAFRVLAGELFPDFRTISNFRKRHQEEFAAVFSQVVQIAQEAGLVKLGTVAIDGSKVRANASRHRAMSYDRMQQEEKRLQQQIRAILDAADAEDRLEDEQFGPDFRGDELPEELASRRTRLHAIQAAKRRLEARKAQEARDEDQRKAERAKRQGKSPPKRRPELRKHPKGQPKPSDQENFTDPDSRIMDAGGGRFEQCYNTQIAVDDAEQIIVGSDVQQCAADAHHLIPMVDQVTAILHSKPRRVLADTGYRSEDNFEALDARGIDGFVAVGREGKPPPKLVSKLPRTRAMLDKLRTKRGRQRYRRRKCVVEPPFGWIKSVLGVAEFSLRGLAQVRAEWHLVCAALNLRRMASRMAWR